MGQNSFMLTITRYQLRYVIVNTTGITGVLNGGGR